MSSENWRLVFFLGFVVLYVAIAFSGIIFLHWRRKTKWPFKPGDRLLRGPGEGLRRRILAIDERFIFEYVGYLVAAVVVGPLLGWTAKGFGLSGWSVYAVVVCGLTIVAMIGAWRISRLWKERSNCSLGWFGERLTAEKLLPLLARGYRVFHDVPCEPGKKGFNIDHVVVGTTGVTVVEVKTRRKGNARPGYKDHEVSFDGSQLDWPWGYDRHGITQALNEADWLEKWIFARTGIKVPVKAVLTLPGWYVREAPSARLRVVNPSFLPDVIQGRGVVTLTLEQVDLIGKQLDPLCRDVEE